MGSDEAGLAAVHAAVVDPVDDGNRIDRLRQSADVSIRGEVSEQRRVEELPLTAAHAIDDLDAPACIGAREAYDGRLVRPKRNLHATRLAGSQDHRYRVRAREVGKESALPGAIQGDDAALALTAERRQLDTAAGGNRASDDERGVRRSSVPGSQRQHQGSEEDASGDSNSRSGLPGAGIDDVMARGRLATPRRAVQGC